MSVHLRKRHAERDLFKLDLTKLDVIVGEKESRAWTIRHGMTAPEAAGVIHTDFQKGFIRAETVSYNDFTANNGYLGAREKGLLRLEGKEYVVKEGDIMNFRFNV